MIAHDRPLHPRCVRPSSCGIELGATAAVSAQMAAVADALIVR